MLAVVRCTKHVLITGKACRSSSSRKTELEAAYKKTLWIEKCRYVPGITAQKLLTFGVCVS